MIKIKKRLKKKRITVSVECYFVNCVNNNINISNISVYTVN